MKLCKFLLSIFAVLFQSSSVGHCKSIVPEHEVFKTKNGVPIYFFASNIPVFEVVLSYKVGSDIDPPGKSGLALLVSQMLRRGVQGLDESQITALLDDEAAGFNVIVGEESTRFETFGLNRNSKAILDLFFKIMKHPSFPEASFRRIKTNQIENIKQMSDMAQVLTGHVLDLTLLNGTEKGRPIGGYLKDIESIQSNDLNSFFKGAYPLSRLQVLVIGGKNRQEILDPLIKEIEAWPNAPLVGKSQKYLRKEFVNKPGRILLIDRPGISEAHVRLGFMGPPRKTPDYHNLEVAEAILSGPFNSRLNQNIREKNGLSYSIDAAFNYGDHFSTFVLTSSTRNEKIGELLLVINKVLSDFAQADDVTLEELEEAKSYIRGSFPLMLNNRYSIARMYFSSLLNDLPSDFLDRYRDQVASVTLEGLKQAIRTHFHLDQMQIVVCGDAKVLGPKLKSAGVPFEMRQAKLYF